MKRLFLLCGPVAIMAAMACLPVLRMLYQVLLQCTYITLKNADEQDAGALVDLEDVRREARWCEAVDQLNRVEVPVVTAVNEWPSRCGSGPWALSSSSSPC